MLESRKKFKKGFTLYLTVLILGLLFAIGIGLSLIVLSQIKISREVGYSVNALCAADSGIERALYGIYKENWPLGTSVSGSVDEASFVVETFFPSPSNCTAQYYCIKSTGEYKGTLRKLDASY